MTLPALDAPCGRHFTFRDLVGAGETAARQDVANVPAEAESYAALTALCEAIVDPVCDRFGRVELTYGFCGPQLARRVPGRISPPLDQHAACERNRKGNLVCPRRGAACDFFVPGHGALAVAQWIVRSLPFDRLYFYGDGRPLHVSHGPEHTRQVVAMEPARPGGRRIPRTVAAEAFLARR